MGRKIPGKKHRGVKDPEKQRRVRLEGLKGKINAAPANPDFQEIPRTIQHIAKLKEQMKHPPPPRRKKPEPLFKQNRNESDKQFLHRVTKSCERVMQEKAFENKYKVDIVRNSVTGEVKLEKKRKDVLDEMLQKARKTKGKKKAKKPEKAQLDTLTRSKSQKRQQKLKEKKQNKAKRTFAEVKHDSVKFGEVVHAPPTLSAPRKVKTQIETRRPGEKSLLLKGVLKKNKSTTVLYKNRNVQKPKASGANVKIDKTAKRKNLPQALRRRLEKQQSEVINAYRDLKKQKKL